MVRSCRWTDTVPVTLAAILWACSGTGCDREKPTERPTTDQTGMVQSQTVQPLPDQPSPADTKDGTFVVPEISLSGRREHDRKRILAAQRLAREHPSDPEMIGSLGILYISENVPGQAAATCFERAIQLAPDDMRWHYYLGYTCARETETDRAKKAYRRAIELDPGYAPSYAMLADLLIESDEPEAAKLYEKATTLNPDLAEAHFGLGRCALLRREVAVARTHFERALVAAPKYAAAHYQLALVYRKLGMPDEAARQLEQFKAGSDPPLTTDPLERAIVQEYDPATSLKYRAMDLINAGRTDAALSVLREILELEPESAQTHYILGTLLASQNRFEEAARQLRRAFEIDPKRIDAKSRYGQIMLRLRREKEGERILREVLAVNPDHGLTLARLGLLMDRQGNRDEAIKLLARAAQLETAHAMIQFDYGKVLAEAGRNAEAARQLGIALRLDPNRAETRELLRTVQERLNAAPTGSP